uniref:Mitochondrial carrier protein n=1 Tax=Heterorhabditis bacteriophora TaxID=37862 RepID=A0A1I7XNB2_HETBA
MNLGLTSPLASLTAINAIVFGVHGSVSREFKDPESLKAHFLAGCAAGMFQSFIAAPSERLKLLIQIQSDAAHTVYRSPIHAARSLVATKGFGTLSRGFLATLLRDCPAFGIYFASYEWMARSMSKDGSMESLTGPQLLLAGGKLNNNTVCIDVTHYFALFLAEIPINNFSGGAGMLSWLFNYPTDVVKTRFQANESYKNYWECIRTTYAEGGIRMFYVGLGSTLIRAFPSNAATFFTVEWTYRLLLDFNILSVGSAAEQHLQIHKRHICMSDFWSMNCLYLLPEAGSTSIDPMIHGCRFL